MARNEYTEKLREDMSLRGLSESTQKSYERVVKEFLAYSGKEARELDEQDVRKYSLELIGRGYKGSTFNTHQAAIRFFFAVTLNRGMNYLQIPRMKKEKKLPEILSREEIALLLERCGNLKHKAIFALAYGSGLRRSEICWLKVQDIDSKHMRIFVRDGKGGKDRYTILSQSCLEILRDYWRAYRPKHPEALPTVHTTMSVEVQDISAAHFDEYRAEHKLTPVQWKAARSIIRCRTAALGAHVDVCDHCGYRRISYNSCRNRHCPKCQTFAKEQWIAKQSEDLLDIHYFHVVFTVPAQLNPSFLHDQRTMYDLLFKAASETVLELCVDKKFLGAKPGITAVLHTWGQNLQFHPHIHMIVTGGGLASDGKWRRSRKKFFLPVRVLTSKFRGKFMAFFRQKFPDADQELLNICYRKKWVVYCKPPFGSAEKVVSYLGRYTHRVAISNNRILSLKDGRVTFLWRDYAHGNRVKPMTIPATEFIRRFLLHVLPSGFRKIRHYGLVSARGKTGRLALCRRLTNTKPPQKFSVVDSLRKILGPDFNLCPCCKTGHLSRELPYGC